MEENLSCFSHDSDEEDEESRNHYMLCSENEFGCDILPSDAAVGSVADSNDESLCSNSVTYHDASVAIPSEDDRGAYGVPTTPAAPSDVVPCSVYNSEFSLPGFLPPNLLPSVVSQLPSLGSTSRICPSASSTFFPFGHGFAQFGLNLRMPCHTDSSYTIGPVLGSVHPRRNSLSNYVDSAGVCRNFRGPCQLNMFDAAGNCSMPARHEFSGTEGSEDEEKLLDQAEGGSVEQKSVILARVEEEDGYAGAFCTDDDPEEMVSLQATAPDEILVSSEEPANFSSIFASYSVAEVNSPSLASDRLHHSENYPISVENTNANSNIDPASNFNLSDMSSMECAADAQHLLYSSNQPNNSLYYATKSSSDDDVWWILCKICHCNVWKLIYIPCGHGSCYSCYRSILDTCEDMFICPFCRYPVRETERVIVVSSVNDTGQPGFKKS